MGRIYTAVFEDVAITAAQDLFEIVAPSTGIIRVHDLHIGQRSDVGDAQEEILLIRWSTGFTTSGSGGSSVTPAPRDPGDIAFGGTVEANNTTQASAGTIVKRYVWTWNIRGSFDKVFTPETRLILSPSLRGCFVLPIAPADSITATGTVTFEVIGS